MDSTLPIRPCSATALSSPRVPQRLWRVLPGQSRRPHDSRSPYPRFRQRLCPVSAGAMPKSFSPTATPTGGRHQFRPANTAPVTLPYWIKLGAHRQFPSPAFASPDGVNWSQVGLQPDHHHGPERLHRLGRQQQRQHPTDKPPPSTA